MGEAAPTQAPPSGFASMLGVGMGGSIPALSASRGSAVPQLHSAIVERLRARIELCRRHHSACQDRYERGQAENSDREHESTLHLLNIVQQGPGNRKSKSSRASQHPPEYSRTNGEHKARSSTETDGKISSHIAQGLRRKIESQAPGYVPKQNGVSSGSDFKRLRVEPNSFRSGSCASVSGQMERMLGNGSHRNVLPRKDFMMPHGIDTDLFNITLRDMKKEPTEVETCGHACADPSMLVFDFKDEVSEHIDPELQDLFDELTKTVPLNDLDLEKMLKQDVDFGLDLGRPSSTGAVHLDKPIKAEYSPDLIQTARCSSQLRPASAGPSFSVANTTLPNAPITSGIHGSVPSRGHPAWPEISHAEQLKQMAANQHHPNAVLQSHQAGAMRNWAHQTSGFNQESVPSNASLSQSPAQTKVVSSCFVKPNGFNQSPNIDSKPLLHFNPKPAASSTGQQTSMMVVPPNKTSRQAQATSSGQGVRFLDCPLPTEPASCLQTKPPSWRPPASQHGISFNTSTQRLESLKMPEQFSRHLTRPPPDYKLSRSTQPGLCTGNVPEQSDVQSLSCQLPNGPGPKLLTVGERRFPLGQDPHPGPPGATQLQQPSDVITQMALQQNKTQFHGANHQEAGFQPSTQQVRLSSSQPSIRDTNTTLSWRSSPKQRGLDLKRLPNTVTPQSGNPFAPRFVCPPNQMAPHPHSSPLAFNPAIRISQTKIPGLPGISQSSSEPQGCTTSFGGLNQSPPLYQNNRVSQHTFDFLPEDDNTVPGINVDSDFIDSLLKSGSGNDDWMKDINLEEILGGHS
ncbi:hypothetical protein DNTS_016641 [Danionella cerebrum]|uniref:Neurogenic mastermind-like N-terminal domain-containing protein n=1 Tax=Danionella cerebrum TaxID=2873325 RepID=A0A553Q095_9TELE|nr:hypothetical protein DNTS_016641 [Danionella translucida]